MSKRILRLLVTLTAIAALGAGGVAFSAANTTRQASGESSTESTAPENSAADPDNVQYTAPGDADYQGAAVARAARSTPAANKTHRRHSRRHASVQRPARQTAPGSQTTPDSQTAPEPNEQAGENESSVESEQGQPGEPANGHEDAPGQNVDHQCTGDCVE